MNFTYLIMQVEIRVHFNGLPAAISIFVHSFQQICVLLYIPEAIPMHCFYMGLQLKSKNFKKISKPLFHNHQLKIQAQMIN